MDAGQGRALYGSGTLFHIYAYPKDVSLCADMSLLDDTVSVNGTRLYDVDVQPVDLMLESGLLCLGSAACVSGDVDGDGMVTEADVTRILELDTGEHSYDDCTKTAGDLNQDRLVDCADAAMLQRWLRGNGVTPDSVVRKATGDSFADYMEGETGTAPELGIGEVSGVGGEVKTVNLVVSSGKALPLAGFSVTLAYPAGIGGLELESVSKGGMWGMNAEMKHWDSDGVLRLSLSQPESMAKSGGTTVTLASLTFRISEEVGEFTNFPVLIQNFMANDAYGYTPRHGAPGQAKSAIITGSVIVAVEDATTKAPLSESIVRLIQASRQGAAAGEPGVYYFPAVADGAYTVQVSRTGYEDASSTIQLSGGASLSVPVSLRAFGSVPDEGEGDNGSNPDKFFANCGGLEHAAIKGSAMADLATLLMVALVCALWRGVRPVRR